MSDESRSEGGGERGASMPAAARAVRGAILESLEAHPRPRPPQLFTRLEATEPFFALHRAASSGLAWLACQDPSEDVRARAEEVFFGYLEAVPRGSAAYRKTERQALRYCTESLRDPALDDACKLKVLDVFHALSLEELTPEEAGRHFRDYDAALRDRFARKAASQPDSAMGLARLLGELTLSPKGSPAERKAEVDRLHALVGACSESAPLAAATLWVCAAAAGCRDGYSSKRMFAALDAAVAASPERALWALTVVGSWPSTEGFGLRARELALRLRSEGVQASAPAPGSFQLAVLTPLKRNGHRDLFVDLEGPDGVGSSLIFSISDGMGLTGVSRVGARAALRKSAEWTPCTEALAREVVADALAKTEAADLWPPVNLIVASALWADLPTVPSERQPCLEDYDFDAIGPVSSEDDEDERLLAPPFDLIFGCDEAYEYVQVWLGGRLEPVTEASVSELLAILERHGERERLIARLEANLELSALDGDADGEDSLFAARVVRTLREKVRPWSELPCVRELARDSLEELDLAVAKRIFCDEAFEESRGAD